jgi:hypothetical protein
VKGFEEHATDRRRLAAAESLARATGVDYAVAYRHLANNTAQFLIESRARAPRRRSARSGSPRWRLSTSCRRGGSPPRRDRGERAVCSTERIGARTTFTRPLLGLY